MEKEIPLYDISGVSFWNEYTNFTLENLYRACNAGSIHTRHGLSLVLPVAVYDKLDSTNQILHSLDGTMRLHLFDVEINEDNDPNARFFDSLIIDSSGNKVIFRTREY